MTADPDEVARVGVEEMWRGDAASRMLGMELVAVAPGTAVVSMRVRDDMVNGWGACHGGIIASLADSAFAAACNSRGTVTVAAGFDVTFLEAGRLGDVLVATARETALRGRSGVYDVTVARPADEADGADGADGPDGPDEVVVAVFRGRSRGLGRPNPAVRAVDAGGAPPAPVGTTGA
ncbi:hydroxyphenylacetyl-CoA thioesterase PaaI [Nocardioides aurantiacus]|uniref:hydroxyphenylacetyl-CoA thioesterase PaaI n=1 Tax=Nocardioides aurantiacus TaxID=86796 RepID=UPI00403F90CE